MESISTASLNYYYLTTVHVLNVYITHEYREPFYHFYRRNI